MPPRRSWPIERTDWTAVEEVHELKTRIANMGPVNLDAISEYADLKERHSLKIAKTCGTQKRLDQNHRRDQRDLAEPLPRDL